MVLPTATKNKIMTTEQFNNLEPKDFIKFAGSIYEVTDKNNMRGFVGIFDEPPTKHIDFLNFNNCEFVSKDLKGLNTKQIGHLTHSLGVSIDDEIPREFYRNYSAYYDKHEDCEKLVELKLMKNYQRLGSEVYSVTEKGIEAVKTLLIPAS